MVARAERHREVEERVYRRPRHDLAHLERTAHLVRGRGRATGRSRVRVRVRVRVSASYPKP